MKCCDLLQSKYLEPADNLHDLLLLEENSINILSQIIVMMYMSSSDTNINTLSHGSIREIWNSAMINGIVLCEQRGVYLWTVTLLTFNNFKTTRNKLS